MEDAARAQRNRVLFVLVAVAIIVLFVPFVPAVGPCPLGAGCPAMMIYYGRDWGSPSYVFFGTGTFVVYPEKDLHNESGHYIPVDNYFEALLILSSCNKGAEFALLQGGPWGCKVLINWVV
jgi:hypothetical protein